MYQYVGNVFKATVPSFDRVMGESVSKVGTVNNAIFPILSPYSIFQKKLEFKQDDKWHQGARE